MSINYMGGAIGSYSQYQINEIVNPLVQTEWRVGQCVRVCMPRVVRACSVRIRCQKLLAIASIAWRAHAWPPDDVDGTHTPCFLPINLTIADFDC